MGERPGTCFTYKKKTGENEVFFLLLDTSEIYVCRRGTNVSRCVG